MPDGPEASFAHGRDIGCREEDPIRDHGLPGRDRARAREATPEAQEQGTDNKKAILPMQRVKRARLAVLFVCIRALGLGGRRFRVPDARRRDRRVLQGV